MGLHRRVTRSAARPVTVPAMLRLLLAALALASLLVLPATASRNQP